MAQPKPSSDVISETAKQESGPQMGSTSAQMQSEIGKKQNFEKAAQDVVGKMQTEPENVTSEDAAHIKSREARVINQAQPPSDSVSADAQRLAAENEGATKSSQGLTKGDLDPATQSAVDRAQNLEKAADQVAPKMASDPEHVTKEEADLLHSREQRAFGETSQGGIASQAQSMASDNQKKGTT